MDREVNQEIYFGHVTLETHIGLAIGFSILELRGHDEGINLGVGIDIRIACPMFLFMITTLTYVPMSIFPMCFGE